MTTMISLRIPDAMRTQYDALAEATGRTRSDLMVEALDAYIAAKMRRIAMIQEGVRQLDEGSAHTHDEVIATLRARGMLPPDDGRAHERPAS
jgi:RHH-type rel operon transcriptional repressor/antitoxin RelB